MATYWHKVKKEKLKEKLKEIKRDFADCSVVKAEVMVENEGAFVILESIEDAKNVLLHNTLIIVGEKTGKGYEEALKKENFAQAMFISAESKTADIEKKLISGVHGAKECHFVIVQSL